MQSKFPFDGIRRVMLQLDTTEPLLQGVELLNILHSDTMTDVNSINYHRPKFPKSCLFLDFHLPLSTLDFSLWF